MSLETPAQDPYADAYSSGPQQPPQSSVGETKERSPPPPPRGRSRSRSPHRFRSPPRRRSPAPRRPSHAPIAPSPSSVLGVFGLSIRTQERDLEDEFNRFGRCEKVTIVYDQRSDRSRGFGFIRMSTVEEAARCIQELNGVDLNGRRIRVDYSITDRPHNPTPGEYMGHRSSSYRGGSGSGRDSYRERDRDRDRDRDHHRESHVRDDYRRGYSSYDRERDRDPFGRDGREFRERRSPPHRGRYSPPPSPRRRRSYSRSPPRGSASSPSKPGYDGGHSNGAPDANGRW